MKALSQVLLLALSFVLFFASAFDANPVFQVFGPVLEWQRHNFVLLQMLLAIVIALVAVVFLRPRRSRDPRKW